MRKFILIVPLLFVSAAYAGPSSDPTFAANETIEQIRPADKPADATDPPARTKAVEPTKNVERTKNTGIHPDSKSCKAGSEFSFGEKVDGQLGKNKRER